MEQNVVESKLLTRTRMERHSKQISAENNMCVSPRAKVVSMSFAYRAAA